MRGVRSGEMLDLSRESGIPWRCWCENTLMCCTVQYVLYWPEPTLYYAVLAVYYRALVDCKKEQHCFVLHYALHGITGVKTRSNHPRQSDGCKTRATCTEIRAGCGQNMNEWKQVRAKWMSKKTSRFVLPFPTKTSFSSLLLPMKKA